MGDFRELFDQWAVSYDNTVFGHNNEYSEVFANYDLILEEICAAVWDKKEGSILEIGVGTGNLTQQLYRHGFQVTGVEPSQEMRKICQGKLGEVEVVDGHFLSIPFTKEFDAVVTSYAFHHLTLGEKREAIGYLDGLIKQGGKLVIADTMFESLEYKEELLQYVESCGSFMLLQDLNTEYYEDIKNITEILDEFNYSYCLEKMNKYVWIIRAEKKRPGGRTVVVESFTMDHRKVNAPFIRTCSEVTTPKGEMITKFDLRFTQPNQEEMGTAAVHTIEHFLAAMMREQLKDIIDISPMGCRTGFYLIVLGKKDEQQVASSLISCLQKIMRKETVPAANEVQCGNYRDLSLSEAKEVVGPVLTRLQEKYQR